MTFPHRQLNNEGDYRHLGGGHADETKHGEIIKSTPVVRGRRRAVGLPTAAAKLIFHGPFHQRAQRGALLLFMACSTLYRQNCNV